MLVFILLGSFASLLDISLCSGPSLRRHCIVLATLKSSIIKLTVHPALKNWCCRKNCWFRCCKEIVFNINCTSVVWYRVTLSFRTLSISRYISYYLTQPQLKLSITVASHLAFYKLAFNKFCYVIVWVADVLYNLRHMSSVCAFATFSVTQLMKIFNPLLWL